MAQSKEERSNFLWRFSQKFQFAADLVKKVKMQRLLGQKTAACLAGAPGAPLRT